MGVEERHVGEEVENEGRVSDTNGLVDQTSRPVRAGLLLLLLLESFVLNLKISRGPLQLMFRRECISVEVVDLSDRGESDEADQDGNGVGERAKEDDAEDLATDAT